MRLHWWKIWPKRGHFDNPLYMWSTNCFGLRNPQIGHEGPYSTSKNWDEVTFLVLLHLKFFSTMFASCFSLLKINKKINSVANNLNIHNNCFGNKYRIAFCSIKLISPTHGVLINIYVSPPKKLYWTVISPNEKFILG